MSTRPRPEDYPTAWSYFHPSRLWRKRTGGSLIVNMAVAAVAGGLAGSQLAVVVFIALAVVVAPARRGQP
jgi:hypothetical protein